MKKKRYIGILVPSRKLAKQTLQIYTRYSPKNAAMFAFMPTHINHRKRFVWGLQLRNKTCQLRRFPIPQVVYNRCYRLRPAPKMEKTMKSASVFNKCNQFDKLEIAGLLRNTNLSDNVPETSPYDREEISRMISRYGTVIFKPIRGSKGQGVFRIEKVDQDLIHISQHHYAPTVIVRDASGLNHEIVKLLGNKLDSYLIQQEIPFRQIDGRHFDIRVLVQKNISGHWGVSNIISRIAHSGCFNSSMCERVSRTDELLLRLYSEEQTETYLHSLHQLSLQAASSIEQHMGILLGEISVDFGIDADGKLWVIEINGMPLKSIYKELKLSRDVYKNPIDYAQYLLSQNR